MNVRIKAIRRQPDDIDGLVSVLVEIARQIARERQQAARPKRAASKEQRSA